MWRRLISDLSSDCKFNAPLSEEWIDKGLADFDMTLNDSLKSFLLETDGLYDYRQFLWMVWNVRDLVAYNKEMRTHKGFADKGYRFEDIFFIANHGEGGVLFGLRIVNSNMQESVVAWFPDTNQRLQIADNLETYLKQWINNSIQI